MQQLVNNQNIMSLLASDSFIVVNKVLIKAIGLHEAVLLSELISERDYWRKRGALDEDGVFFSTVENIEERTTFTRHQQTRLFKELEDKGLVKRERVGVQAKRGIRISDNRILTLIESNSVGRENGSLVGRENGSLIAVKTADSYKNNKKNTNKRINNVETQRVFDLFLEKFEKNENLYKLTTKRKAMIQRRLNDAGYDLIEQAITKCSQTAFYRGENARNWKADLDFILKSYEQVERLSQLETTTQQTEESEDFSKYLIERTN